MADREFLDRLEGALHEHIKPRQTSGDEHQRAQQAVDRLVHGHLQDPQAALRLATEHVAQAAQAAEQRLLPEHAALVRQQLQGSLNTAILLHGFGRL